MAAARRCLVGVVHLGEAFGIGDHQIDHDARRLVAAGAHDEGFLDQHRGVGVEHDARFSGIDEAIAEAFDEAGMRGTLGGRNLEVHLRQVDDHPERVGQHIDVVANGKGEFGDELHMAGIA